MNPTKRKKLLRLNKTELKQVVVLETKVEVKNELSTTTTVVQEAAPLQEATLEMGLKVADEIVVPQQVDYTKKDKKKKSFTQDV